MQHVHSVQEVVDSLNGNSTRLSRLLASTASVLAAVDVLLASASKVSAAGVLG